MKQLFIVVFLLFSLSTTYSQVDVLSFSSTDNSNSFPLVTKGKATPVWVDTADYAVVQIAARLFAEDVQRVTDVLPKLSKVSGFKSDRAIIIGTIGKNALIDQMIKSKKLDVSAIQNQWESYIIKTVKNPVPGIKNALVIVGSDRRGTAFGVFTLSEAMGVSPWYWWADVTPQKQAQLFIDNVEHIQNSPSVKYRGIFINDECGGLNPWAKYILIKELGDIGPKTYAKVFELLLRLKANYCWPAMHKCTKAFNLYPENKVVADNYAIVMGSSHCEQILRNNETEWDKETMGEYNYVTNTNTMNAYWEERAKTNGMYENTYTIGVRGAHDYTMKGAKTLDERVRYTQLAIDNQRDIIARNINPDTSKVAQVLCAYKEVLEIYQNGLEVPDDVTLLWADDNFGFIRRLSDPQEQKRSGGSGVYYHLSYFGDPEGWLWLSTLSPSLIAYEMQKAYAYNADRIWVFNVGDIKPAEKELTLAMEMAWDIKKWTPANAHTFIGDWAARTFGQAYANPIAEIMNEFYRLASLGKPEHIKFIDYSELEMHERIEACRAVSDKAEKLYAQIPQTLRDAYYQLILYPVKGASLMNEYYLLSRLSLVEAAKGNDKALDMAAEAKKAYLALDSMTDIYHKGIANGKWNGMMTWRPYKEMDKSFIWPHATDSLVKRGKAFPEPITVNLNQGQFVAPMLFDGNNLVSNAKGEIINGNTGSATFLFNSEKAGNTTLWFKTTSRIKWMSFKPSENTFWDVVVNGDSVKGAVTPIGNIWHATDIGPIWNRIGDFDIVKGENRLAVSQTEQGAAIHAIYFGNEPPLDVASSQRVDATNFIAKSDAKEATITPLLGLGANGGVSLMPFTAPTIANDQVSAAPYIDYQIKPEANGSSLTYFVVCQRNAYTMDEVCVLLFLSMAHHPKFTTSKPTSLAPSGKKTYFEDIQ
jgi:hypothetical protein